MAVQNLVIYRGHYFADVGFPFDFAMSYYAMVAFWVGAVGSGVFPEWVPFQQMGYPFALQAQSSLTYVPLWIFPALDIPYTLRAAIVVQCLHVLIGAVGMYALARLMLGSRGYALVAALAFQFFGGFYSNAQHVDIVRAFAYAPWLLYVYSFGWWTPTRMPGRMLLIPPVLYLFLTGSYPGNVFAALVILGAFGVCEAAAALGRGSSPALVRSWLTCGGLLTCLGGGMAILRFGPLWLFREQYARATPLESTTRQSLGLEHLPGFFATNSSLPGETSMTSTYVTLPIVLLACMTPAATLRRHWPMLAVAAVATIMAAGERTPVAPTLSSVLPILGLSRFPSSDYRVFMAIPLILLGVSGLWALATQQLSARSIAVRSLAGSAVVIWGLMRAHPETELRLLLGVGALCACLAGVALVAQWSRRLPHVAVLTASVLVVGDAARVLPNVEGWSQPLIDTYYHGHRWPPYSVDGGRSVVSSDIFRRTVTSRPARIAPVGLVRWAGYLDGRFYVGDLTPNVLRSANLVTSQPLYQRYMLMAWTPWLLRPDAGDKAPALTDSDFSTLLDSGGADNGVIQTEYGVNQITYRVSLREPRWLVENEMYFPGWQARLSLPDTPTLDAVSTNGIFRSWQLPAGDYTMVARFSLPYRSTLLVLCGGFTFCYGLWLIWWWRQRD